MQVTVHNKQSILDVSIQECGIFESVFAIAKRNGIAITDDLSVGQSLEFASEDIIKKDVVGVFSTQGIKPATAISDRDLALVPWCGINFMSIEIDFKVDK